jgi:flagellar export protein FliJ
MTPFAFSLQRVLDYRRLEDQWAQEAFRLARAAVAEAEWELDMIRSRRTVLDGSAVETIAARMALEACHNELTREEESAQNRLALLANDEARALDEWKACRVAAEALAKLREAAFDEWTREQARLEQIELDEWAVMRR